jgi:hypothetical protein
MKFKSRRRLKKKKKKKNVFCKLENLFLLLLFHYSFPLHLKDDF